MNTTGDSVDSYLNGIELGAINSIEEGNAFQIGLINCMMSEGRSAQVGLFNFVNMEGNNLQLGLYNTINQDNEKEKRGFLLNYKFSKSKR